MRVNYTLLWFLVATVAAVIGFFDIGGESVSGVAKGVFFLFAGLTLINLLRNTWNAPRPPRAATAERHEPQR